MSGIVGSAAGEGVLHLRGIESVEDGGCDQLLDWRRGDGDSPAPAMVGP
ncbi:hypothetical protein [Homoserinimonas sp. OAct 916]|nr:hypothetical protein [Homoserinimonas sp. OAct 916]